MGPQGSASSRIDDLLPQIFSCASSLFPPLPPTSSPPSTLASNPSTTMPETRYGMPYILEDTTGRLTGTEFVDIHERLHFTIRCTARDAWHTSYMVYNTNPAVFQSAIPKPLAGLDFGVNNALGTISFSGVAMPMRKYLTKPSTPLGSSKVVRRFVASDGQTYQWARRTQPNQEWTCTNPNGYIIASYSLKAMGEPEYRDSSGCVFEIAEQFGSLVPEILASLWIMRHIAAYDLA
ncbi:hypothetical protein C8R46DRAFT_1082007 [Mycena filopes]|nr:hypothetical protein C8R46DRAFT_1082007 [Mycena filopes]